jgi:hypothetical protein
MNVKKTKVYQLFACLSEQERKDFSRFLATHSKPRRLKLRKSLAFLCAHSTEIAAPKSAVSNEDWWAEVFPEMKYKQSAMGKHQHALTHDLEAFLVDRKLRKEADAQLARLRACEQLLLLLDCLQERGEDHLFDQYARRLGKLLEGPLPDGDAYALRYRYTLHVIAQKQKTLKVSAVQDFVRCKQDLDRHYSLATLYLRLGLGDKLPEDAGQAALFDLACVTELTRHDDPPHPLADTLLAFLTVRKDYDITDWNALHDRLETHIGDFPTAIWIDLANTLFNLCSPKVEMGQIHFKEAVLRFYGLIHKADVFEQIFRETPAHWVNLWMLSSSLQDFDLFKHYLTRHPDYLNPDESMVFKIVCMECLELFCQEDYEQAWVGFLRLYATATQKGIQNVAAFNLLRCYYLLSNIDDFKMLKGSFRKRIKEDRQMKPGTKAAYETFLGVIGKLFRIHFNRVSRKNKKQLKELLELVRTTPALIARGWLLEKIMELLRQIDPNIEIE